ncbi:MAG: helix-hairpin-helix domain-containing protein [Cellulosilyticaceae bacterium]
MIKLLSKYKIIFLPILLIAVSFLFTIKQNNSYDSWNDTKSITWDVYEEESKSVSTKDTEELDNLQVTVPIYICGQVSNPGVYYVDADDIINEAIVLAGGFTLEADTESINLARQIKSNEKIYIPKQGEEIDKTDYSYEDIGNTSQLININYATVEELDTLPNIGKTRAQQIIDYRSSNGTFLVIEDIKNVPGIGEKIFESLKDFITIE